MPPVAPKTAPASPYSWYVELMSRENASEVIAGDLDPSALCVTATDDRALVVKLTQPLPYFPQMVTHFTTFPVPRAPIEEFGADWSKTDNMVSNGAYVLTEHVPQENSCASAM